VLPLEQRQPVGREPLLGRQSGERSVSWVAQPQRLRHRGIMAITATQSLGTPPMGIQRTDIPPTVIRPTHNRDMGIQARQALKVIPVPRPTGDTLATPVLRIMNTNPAQRGPLTPVRRVTDHRATRDTVLPLVPQARGIKTTWGTPPIPLRRATDIKADRHTPSRLAAVIDLPYCVIPTLMFGGRASWGRGWCRAARLSFGANLTLDRRQMLIWYDSKAFLKPP
jgi:hypothetical protein